MDALIEFVDYARADAADREAEREGKPDRSVVGMDKVWYNCTDDYLD
jgi:hypothetical protein